MLLSRDLTGESRILYHRQITERVKKIAPFLNLDRDSYPVVTTEGSSPRPRSARCSARWSSTSC